MDTERRTAFTNVYQLFCGEKDWHGQQIRYDLRELEAKGGENSPKRNDKVVEFLSDPKLSELNREKLTDLLKVA
jgi:hypothetical protein